MPEPLRIAFAGGGTAGHLYPAVNLAKAFEKKGPVKSLFFGTKRGIEAKKIPEFGYDLVFLDVRGFQRYFTFENLMFLFRLAGSFIKSRRELKKFKPHVVIGTGGYVMGPVLKMANRMKIPTIVQEQNSFPGVTTRLLAKNASAVFIAYDEARQYLDNKANIFFAGNPVVVKKPETDRSGIFENFNLNPGLKTVFIFGGSQGAASINKAVKEILSGHSFGDNVQFLWQCGSRNFDEYKNWLKDSGRKNIELRDFINDMWSVYRIADFCICRAGAMSLSEIAIAGLPAILIPLKSAAGNHQFKNAKTMVDKNCAEIIEDNDRLSENLKNKITHWLENPDKLFRIKKNLAQIAQPDAADEIVSRIEEILKQSKSWPV